MTDRPILFSAPMVCALLAGRKTQTRRALKPQPVVDGRSVTSPPNFHFHAKTEASRDEYLATLAPYAIGDRLWCREYCAIWGGTARHVVYRADENDAEWAKLLHDRRNGAPWVLHPRSMPRWASRITLTVTDVRVQRVQDIWGQDFRAEGMHIAPGPPLSPRACEELKPEFAILWNNLNAKRGFGWDTNPWVAAYTFERIDNRQRKLP